MKLANKIEDNITKKKKTVKELKGVNVVFVSYVPKGANQLDFLIKKDAKKEDATKETSIKIIQKNQEERLVLGVVYEPYVEDSQGDFMSAEEIQKSCHSFNEHFRAIDKDHNCLPGVGTVMESYIAPEDLVINSVKVKKGSWLLKSRPNEETWEVIKSGNYNGYSFFGWAEERKEVNLDEFEARKLQYELQKSQNVITEKGKTNKTTKDFDAVVTNDENNNVFKYIYMLEESIWIDKYINELSGTELRDAILKSIAQLTNKVSNMTFEIIKIDDNNVETKKSVDNNNEKETSVNKTAEVEMNREEIQEMIKETIADTVAKAITYAITPIKETLKKMDLESTEAKKSDELAPLKEQIQEITAKAEESEKTLSELKTILQGQDGVVGEDTSKTKKEKIKSDDPWFS